MPHDTSGSLLCPGCLSGIDLSGCGPVGWDGRLDLVECPICEREWTVWLQPAAQLISARRPLPEGSAS